MSNDILFIVVIIAIASGAAIGFGLIMLGKKGKHSTEGLDAFNAQANAKKDAAKAGILQKIEESGRITNDEVQSLAGVSDSTASRYLDELQAEKKIIAQGEGRGVFYTKP